MPNILTPRLLRASGDFSTYLYQAYTGGCGLLWLAWTRASYGSEVFNCVVPEQTCPAFQQDVLVQAQQYSNVTYTAAGSQLALMWPAQATGRTRMSVCTCL